MQVVAGLLTHALAIERPALSILKVCYSFDGEDNRIVLRLPDEVFAELWCAAFIVLIARADLARPLHPSCYCTDSSLYGFSVYEASFDDSELGEVIAIRER